MPESILRILEQMPFLMMATKGQAPQLNRARVVESLIIAALTAGVTTWGVVQVLEYRLGRVETEVAEFRADMFDARVSMGDRWTRTDDLTWQRTHGEAHGAILNRLDTHEVKGH